LLALMLLALPLLPGRYFVLTGAKRR
jgi:hypothetical protein